MKLGVVFPQTEIGGDPGPIREYVLAAERAGYDHLLAFDHVLGAPPDRLAALGRRPPYTHESSFQEPLVLFGYIAALTERLELVSGVIILPQRQTALVAKQAAVVDRLSGGRLRLGVGLGWNYVEYEALGEDFHTRGRRVAEQIEVMRRLWTEPLVTFEGKWHHVDRAGIHPLPVQQPIPVWMGGSAEPVIRRTARIADGWFPQFQPSDEARASLERMRGLVRDAGRDPDAFGVEGRVSSANGGPSDWVARAAEWRALGVSHLSLNTMGAGYTSPQQHIDAILRFKEAMSAANL